MSESNAIPDFSSVKDPIARGFLEQMGQLNTSLQKIIEQQQKALDEQTGIIKKLQGEIAEFRRALFGKKSERMPPINREVKKRSKERGNAPEEAKQESQERRRRNATVKKELPTERVIHCVPENDHLCPVCGGSTFRDLGVGEVSYEYEYVPPQFIRREHIRKKKTCSCRSYVVTAPGPKRVSEGVNYGPGFHAQVVVAKCDDSLPLYRQAKQLERVGVPMARSTLGDIFHRSGDFLCVLRNRMLDLLSSQLYVNADETRVPVLAPEKTRQAYLWTFIAHPMVVYVYSASRSGETPRKILGESQGFIQVDAFSGYNSVCTPERRTRVGCLAHARRYFFKAQETAPTEATWVMDKILDLYRVEYEAAGRNILGTGEHLLLRRVESASLMEEIQKYLEGEKDRHLPQGPMGRAITYMQNNWDELTQFLKDPKLSLDNNISERQLRVVALGRKNFLFLGNDEAGDHLAVLQSLVSSCKLNKVNPQAYLADVLIRIQTHPASQIDELLPHNWKSVDSS